MAMRKKSNHIIREIILFIPVLIFCFGFKEAHWPFLSYGFLILIFLAYVKSIYDYCQYKNGKIGYVAIPTINNEYGRFMSFTMGTFLIVGAIIYFNWSNDAIENVALGFALGTLGILNGVFYMPNGMFKFNKGKIEFTGLEYDLKLDEVSEVQLYDSKIVILLTDNELIHTFNFKLDHKSKRLINDYVSSRMPRINVKNYLDDNQYSPIITSKI